LAGGIRAGLDNDQLLESARDSGYPESFIKATILRLSSLSQQELDEDYPFD
jgi:hypothetical protein